MSQEIEENRKSWPKEVDNFSIGNKVVDSHKIWEPASDYANGGEYGKIQVTTYRGGQSIEIDNTEGGERIRVIHPSGSYVEMQHDGTVVHRSANDDYEVISGDKNVRVRGATNIQIDGDVNMKVSGNMDIDVGESISLKSKGPVIIDTPHLDIRADRSTHNNVNVGNNHRHTGVVTGPNLTGGPT